MTRGSALASRAAVVALIAAPIAKAVGDMLRLSVVGDVPDNDEKPISNATDMLAAIAEKPGTWQSYGLLDFAFAMALLVAGVTIVGLASQRRPVLAAVAGFVGTVYVVSFAMHIGFFTTTVQVLAGQDESLAEAAAKIFASDSGPLLGTGVALVILSTLLSVILFGVLVVRAGLAPWWAAVIGFGGYFVFDFETSTTVVQSLLPLLLLVPFGFVARSLVGAEEPRVLVGRVP